MSERDKLIGEAKAALDSDEKRDPKERFDRMVAAGVVDRQGELVVSEEVALNVSQSPVKEHGIEVDEVAFLVARVVMKLVSCGLGIDPSLTGGTNYEQFFGHNLAIGYTGYAYTLWPQSAPTSQRNCAEQTAIVYPKLWKKAFLRLVMQYWVKPGCESRWVLVDIFLWYDGTQYKLGDPFLR